ncbi:hypothetical protein GM3708_3523 (plasmid) [Geminocystis sp. NIES-3708]|uniref:hypothetical protein n=1 Tax=Geminocystis sp. NIES-3708 TaxID=1615909 RepID=UPI0005FCC1A0|nr:hypothetical protein [Geminocystis sp. NIES-3708]BAQ63117.1 hypothetical protein GM3708_3523 [Geminocystis sp. NIES-3708]
MFFQREPSSKNPIAENIVLLPNLFADEVEVYTEHEYMLSLEQAIDQIGILPTIVQTEYTINGINLDSLDLQILSNFLIQYRDISEWLRVLVIPNDKAKAELEKITGNLVQPLAEYFAQMLEALKICLKERQLGKNSPPNFCYSLWFDMVHSYFVESIENSGFLKPFSNHHQKSKRELTDRWRDDINARLKIVNEASINDCSMFSPIDDNWELFKQKEHKIFFEDSLRWAKENDNGKVIDAIRNLWKQEKKLVDIISKRKGCAEYKFFTVPPHKLCVNGRERPEGFGNPSTSKRKKSKGGKKNKIPERFGDLDFVRG